jgi:hypothetical protein
MRAAILLLTGLLSLPRVVSAGDGTASQPLRQLSGFEPTVSIAFDLGLHRPGIHDWLQHLSSDMPAPSRTFWAWGIAVRIQPYRRVAFGAGLEILDGRVKVGHFEMARATQVQSAAMAYGSAEFAAWSSRRGRSSIWVGADLGWLSADEEFSVENIPSNLDGHCAALRLKTTLRQEIWRNLGLNLQAGWLFARPSLGSWAGNYGHLSFSGPSLGLLLSYGSSMNVCGK